MAKFEPLSREENIRKAILSLLCVGERKGMVVKFGNA